MKTKPEYYWFTRRPKKRHGVPVHVLAFNRSQVVIEFLDGERLTTSRQNIRRIPT